MELYLNMLLFVVRYSVRAHAPFPFGPEHMNMLVIYFLDVPLAGNSQAMRRKTSLPHTFTHVSAYHRDGEACAHEDDREADAEREGENHKEREREERHKITHVHQTD